MNGALKWRPDKNRDKVIDVEARFISVHQAYEILKDENKRRTYDSRGLQGVFGGSDGAAEPEPDVEQTYRPFFSTASTSNYGGTSSAGFTSHTGEDNNKMTRRRLTKRIPL